MKLARLLVETSCARCSVLNAVDLEIVNNIQTEGGSAVSNTARLSLYDDEAWNGMRSSQYATIEADRSAATFKVRICADPLLFGSLSANKLGKSPTRVA